MTKMVLARSTSIRCRHLICMVLPCARWPRWVGHCVAGWRLQVQVHSAARLHHTPIQTSFKSSSTRLLTMRRLFCPSCYGVVLTVHSFSRKGIHLVLPTKSIKALGKKKGLCSNAINAVVLFQAYLSLRTRKQSAWKKTNRYIKPLPSVGLQSLLIYSLDLFLIPILTLSSTFELFLDLNRKAR
jgi:hypothetical protein